MSDIPSTSAKVQLEATQFRAPTSESLMQTMGGAVNYCIDGVTTQASQISVLQATVSSYAAPIAAAAKLSNNFTWQQVNVATGSTTWFTVASGKFRLVQVISKSGVLNPPNIFITRAGLTLGTYNTAVFGPAQQTYNSFLVGPGDTVSFISIGVSAFFAQYYEFDMTGA